MAKKAKGDSKAKAAEALMSEEERARHNEEHPDHPVVSHTPAAAALLGTHPEHADDDEASGSPSADLEREQAEERGDDP